jgi:hypothetical protein
MAELREFVAEVLERRGAAVEAVEPDGLEVLAPEKVRKALNWPELARLGFGAQRREGAIPIGLEGDWLDRFGALFGDEGRWAERQLSGGASSCGDPARLLEHGLDLPNAVWRARDATATFTRCLMLAFRYTALSDEKREGMVWLAFNTATGAEITDIAVRLRRQLQHEEEWQEPTPEVRAAAGPPWDCATLDARVRPALDAWVKNEIAPFLRAMRRRLDRDRDRVHSYHDDLRRTSLKRLAAIGKAGTQQAGDDKADGDRRREEMRVAAIEREYRAKLDDLRRNYALRVTVEWVQTLELFVPVQRLDVLIRRRKGERLIRLDWHPLVRMLEPPVCEAGPGYSDLEQESYGRTRLVCDDHLHLVAPAALSPCPFCAKAFCRACHPIACPRCRAPLTDGSTN